MPAKSEAQKNLMKMVYAYKKGSIKLSKLPKDLAEKIKNISREMSMASVKHFTESDLTFKDWKALINPSTIDS